MLYLALSLAAAKLRADYARHWPSPGVTDMDYLRDVLGDQWTNPTIPPDAYRAQYPPPSP